MSQSNSERAGFAKLGKGEQYWRDRYQWLLERGYRLRTRYHPDWVPSWQTDPNLSEGLTEDSETLPFGRLIDAIREVDDSYVILKRISRKDSPEEVNIFQYFTQEPQRSDPRNHVADLLEVLHPPDEENDIIVLPVLRPYDSPEFDTVGEGLDFIRQTFQGLCFLHDHRVAHRDIRSENFLLDGKDLYSDRTRAWDPNIKYDFTGPAPLKQTRTTCWPKYYIIDFGFSKQYLEENMPPSETPKFATDQTVPEFRHRDVPCNPFPIDVYTFGNLIRVDFIDGDPTSNMQHGRKGFEFLRPLVEAMTEEEPSKRPTMLESLERFDDIASKLSQLKLRSRPVRIPGGGVHRPNSIEQIRVTTAHWARKAKFVLKGVPALPFDPLRLKAAPRARIGDADQGNDKLKPGVEEQSTKPITDQSDSPEATTFKLGGSNTSGEPPAPVSSS
ncbi:hypothetical protein FA13DRAFT_1747516 [Coprinellus micaceus]|uniref:Protein kinase domain-containing protein n=1 Tax=Coprinellus micaceus TaxID=71717 RepID=A0A4Y7S2U9_COPMI|nr:hypothetical protein FA13DRAFT_1747516 [Coprinellus micaceus]